MHFVPDWMTRKSFTRHATADLHDVLANRIFSTLPGKN